MKKSIAAAVTALTTAAQVSLALAQTPRPQVVSPEVTADRRIILRLYAPAAQQVAANGELDGKPHPLTKGSDGVWTATIGRSTPTSTPTPSTWTASRHWIHRTPIPSTATATSVR